MTSACGAHMNRTQAQGTYNFQLQIFKGNFHSKDTPDGVLFH